MGEVVNKPWPFLIRVYLCPSAGKIIQNFLHLDTRRLLNDNLMRVNNGRQVMVTKEDLDKTENPQEEVNAKAVKEEAAPEAPPNTPDCMPEEEPAEAKTSEAAGTEESGARKISEFSKTAAAKAGELLGKSYRKASEYDPRTAPGIIDRFVNWIRNTFPPEMYNSISDWFTRHGHAGIVVAQILTVLYALIAVIVLKEGRRAEFAYGLGMAMVLFVLQYVSYKFLNAGKKLIETSPSRVGSTAFLDCTFLLLEIAGIVVFLSLCTKGLANFFIGLGIWAICDAIAFTALHPEMINISVAEDVRAGEEAIGIMSFFAKAIVRIVPIAFGVGAIVGTIALLMGLFPLMASGTIAPCHNALTLISVCLCLPFASYVFFALYHLFIDVIRAILVLPEKLDRNR